MNIVKEWFEEAYGELRVHSIPHEEFVIYKGIRVSMHTHILDKEHCLSDSDVQYSIVDANRSDGYPELVDKDRATLELYGFIEGCDIIGHNRDLKNIQKLNSRVVLLYEKRRKYEVELPRNERLNLKRIRNINVNVKILLDQMFLHNIRAKQFKIKYNTN